MVTKKQAKKNKEKHSHSDQSDQKKLFGLDLKSIGGAIATAVVTEIAQTALSKASHSNPQDSSRDGGSVASGVHQVQTQAEGVAASMGEKVGGVAETLAGAASETGDRLKGTLSATEEKVENWQPVNGSGVASRIVQEILEEVKPTLIQFIETIIETTETAYRSSIGTADSWKGVAADGMDAVEQSVSEPSQLFRVVSGEVLRSVQNGVAGAVDTAKTAFEEVKDPKPKGKKKKKKNKK